jgi:hypothetical protein
LTTVRFISKDSSGFIVDLSTITDTSYFFTGGCVGDIEGEGEAVGVSVGVIVEFAYVKFIELINIITIASKYFRYFFCLTNKSILK